MATLNDVILGTGGLLGYFNTETGTDSNGGELALTINSMPTYGTYLTSERDYTFTAHTDAGDFILLENAPLDIKCIEFFFYSVAISDNDWSGVLGVDCSPTNRPKTGFWVDDGYSTPDSFGIPISYDGDFPKVSETIDWQRGNRRRAELQHFCFIEENGVINLYIDGVLSVTMNHPSLVAEQGNEILIGGVYEELGIIAIENRLSNIAVYDRPLTEAEMLERVSYKSIAVFPPVNLPYVIFKKNTVCTPIWSNRETHAQANPQPDYLTEHKHRSDIKLLGKSGNYQSLLNQQGEQRLTGYITGTVKQEQIPVSKTVYLFTQYGQLIEETKSDKLGNYRFDHLQLNEKFMITAKAGHEPDLPPDYHPDTVGYITPTAYKL